MQDEKYITCDGGCYEDSVFHKHIEDAPPTCMLRKLQHLCITCIDISAMIIESLDGVEFSSSVTCLAMNIASLDTSKLPPNLQFLELGNFEVEYEMVIIGKLPDFLRSLEVYYVRLHGLDIFTPESKLKTLALLGVGLPQNTALDVIPRTVTTLFLKTKTPIILTGFPPNLRYLGLSGDLVQPNTNILLPPSLETLMFERRIWTMIERSMPNVVALTMYDTHSQAIDWLPPNLKSLICGRNELCKNMVYPNLSFIWTDNQLNLDGFVKDRFGQDEWCYTSNDWNQVAVSTILLSKRSSVKCPFCEEPSEYPSKCDSILGDVLGVRLPSEIYSKLDAQIRLLTLLSGQGSKYCSLRKLPQEVFRFLAVFLC